MERKFSIRSGYFQPSSSLTATWLDMPLDQYTSSTCKWQKVVPTPIKMFTLKPVASKRLGSATLTGKESPQYSYTINKTIWLRYRIVLRVLFIDRYHDRWVKFVSSCLLEVFLITMGRDNDSPFGCQRETISRPSRRITEINNESVNSQDTFRTL